MSDNQDTTTTTNETSQNQNDIVAAPQTEQGQLLTLEQLSDFIVTKIQELRDTDPRLTSKDPKPVPEDSVPENRSGEGKSSSGKRKVAPAKLPKNKKSKKETEDSDDLFSDEDDDDLLDDDSISLPGSDIEEDLKNLIENKESDDSDDSDDGDTGIFSLHKDIMEELEDAIKKDKTSTNLNKKLAKVLKTLWNQKSGDHKKVKDKIEKIARPKNCKFFRTQKVNDDIFTKLRKDVKGQDQRLQKSQTFLTKAAISISKILGDIMQTDTSTATKANFGTLKACIDNVKKEATDAFSMLSYMHSGMVQYRKDKICRSLSKNIRSLRNVHEPNSEWLFGDNVLKKVKLIKKQSTLIESNTFNTNNKNNNSNNNNTSGKNSLPSSYKAPPSFRGGSRGRGQYRGRGSRGGPRGGQNNH